MNSPYNPGRFIALEAQAATDADVRDFQTELRACTEGTLTGSDDAQYTEAKFLQVKQIIERFRGREGSAEADRRSAAKVTDVRQWFVFAALQQSPDIGLHSGQHGLGFARHRSGSDELANF